MDTPNERKQIDLASAYYTKGRKLWSKGERENALDLFRKALSIQEAILGIYSKHTARTYYWVGYALNHKKDYGKALVAYRRTLRIRLFLLGDEDVSTEDVKRALRDVLKEQGLDDIGIADYIGNIAAAVQHEKEARQSERRGDYTQAVEDYEKYLAIEEGAVGSFPLDIARIHSKIGDVLKLNHKESMAISSYRRALSIFVPKLGRKHSDSQHCITGIGVCASFRGLKASESERYMELVFESIALVSQGNELEKCGKIDDAINKYEKALKIESETIDMYPLAAAQIHLHIASCFHIKKQFDREIVILRKALGVFLTEYGKDHSRVTSCLREMTTALREKGCSSEDMNKYLNTVSYSVQYERNGNSIRKEGDVVGAINELQKALDIEISALGKYHLTQVTLFTGIALAYDAQGKHSFASTSYRNAIFTNVANLGLGYPNTESLFIKSYETAKRGGRDIQSIGAFQNIVLSSIELEMSGNDQLTNQQYVKAFATFHGAILAEEEAMGQLHLCTCTLYAKAAEALLRSGQYDRALKKYRELLYIQQSSVGYDHSSSQSALEGIGGALVTKKLKSEDANQYLTSVVQSVAHELTGDHLIKEGSYDHAIMSYNQALQIERNLLGESYLTTAGLFDKIASTHVLQGQCNRAILTFRKSIRIYQTYDEPDYGDIARTLKLLNRAIQSLGFNISAVERYKLAIQTSIAHEIQGDAALLAGNSGKAICKYQMAIDLEEGVLGKLHPTTSSFYKKIADISRDKEDFESAVLFYSKTLAIEESYLGKENEDTVTTYNQLMNAAQKQGATSGASLDGWNMLKYVLTGLIGLLVLIVSVTKDWSKNQRTIKTLKIAAYDTNEDSDDGDTDNQKGDNPKGQLEPPEQRNRDNRSADDLRTNEYMRNNIGDSDNLSLDTRFALTSGRAGNVDKSSIARARPTFDQSPKSKPVSLANEETSDVSSVKDTMAALAETTKSKIDTRKDEDTLVASVLDAQKFEWHELAEAKGIMSGEENLKGIMSGEESLVGSPDLEGKAGQDAAAKSVLWQSKVSNLGESDGSSVSEVTEMKDLLVQEKEPNLELPPPAEVSRALSSVKEENFDSYEETKPEGDKKEANTGDSSKTQLGDKNEASTGDSSKTQPVQDQDYNLEIFPPIRKEAKVSWKPNKRRTTAKVEEIIRSMNLEKGKGDNRTSTLEERLKKWREAADEAGI